ncbi:cilia- and flagella-associated protein 91 isoform X2 [Parambassis ranga]|uniref:Cilia- and flagella-associated protein 91 n=1 Tax=Parambassis ranga TaxID=210632 RepID=A0A6P7HLC5_9TELE|nr:cilia- and flagella-associated protein 91 isoform X2 [Parambassis ranga]
MSTSVTRTVIKKNDGSTAFRRERCYDCLYDPGYTVSSEADYRRVIARAYASKCRIRKVPEFTSLFSTPPRYTIKVDPSQPVPAFTNHQWSGQSEQRREALQQLAGITPNTGETKKGHVTGADYWKYFKCPLIPFPQQVPPNVIVAFQKEDFVTTIRKNAEREPTHVTVGVQTDYRENETQTDPYSPAYVLRPGTTPSELLQLAALTWGHGLPAGLAEVEMIERARAKRAWEATLPPPNDMSQLDKRRRMMEEMEAKEWAFREGEIQKLQDARLAVLKDLLMQRDEAQEHVTNERLNQIYSKFQNNKKAAQHKIHNDYLRSLRKLEAKRKNVEGKLKRHGIVVDAQMYVPRIVGAAFTRNNVLKNNYLDTYEGLEELEAGLCSSPSKPGVKRSKGRDTNDAFKAPVTRALRLMKKYKTLREEEENLLRKKSLRFLSKKKKPVPRPVTPRVENPAEGDEETELAVIHLQKLIRGRSIQYELFEGKEKYLDLIQELRTVHALQSEEQALQEADKELITTLKKQRDQQRHKISEEEASRAEVVGSELEQLFDTLSKELIRLQEERRIHAFTLLAERERRLREAEESGRRQVEERRRKEEDEIFKQVVQVHQESVDLYLEDIILGTVEQIADDQAREEIHKKTKEVNDIAYAMDKSRDSLQSEEIVSEMVYSFLIPEVEKMRVRQTVHQKQQRHLLAARSVIQGTTESAEIPSSTEGASQKISPSKEAPEEMFSQVEPGNEAEQQHTDTEETEN